MTLHIINWAISARLVAGMAIFLTNCATAASIDSDDSLSQAIVRTIWGAGQAAPMPLSSQTLPAAEVGMLIGLSATDGFLEEYPEAEFVMYTSSGYPEVEWGFRTFLVRQPATRLAKTSRLLIYNHGHVGWYFSSPDARALLRWAYSEGYDLLLTAMPMVAWNTPPRPIRAKTWDGWGEFSPTATSHAFFPMIDTGQTHYLKFFLDPVTRSFEQVMREGKYETADMVGISGGGWSALLVGAIEPRLRKIICVAGFLPMRHRKQSGDFGDSEQVSASFYRKHTYDSLVAAASRSGTHARELWLMYNDEDPCCFGGAEATRYADELRAQGDTQVRVVIRKSKVHDLDFAAIREILAAPGRTAQD